MWKNINFKKRIIKEQSKESECVGREIEINSKPVHINLNLEINFKRECLVRGNIREKRNIFILGLILFIPLSFFVGCLTQVKADLASQDSFVVLDEGLGFNFFWKWSEEELVEVKDLLNFGWNRADFFWEHIEPVQGEWRFERFDRYCQTSKNANVKILAVLAYDTPWLHKDSGCINYVAPEEVPLFLKYIEKTVTRYKDSVDAWEIWNEPNGERFWPGSDEDFYYLLKETYALIKQIDPTSKVLVGSYFRAPKRFIRKMFEYGAMENVDIISYHPYGIGPDGVLRLSDIVINEAKSYGFTGEFWVSEMGFPTAGFYPLRCTEKQLPGHIVKSFTYLALLKTKMISYYELSDYTERSPFKSEENFGLTNREDHKLANDGGHGYSLFSKTVLGSIFVGKRLSREKNVSKGIETYLFYNPAKGQYTFLAWSNSLCKASLRIEGLPQKSVSVWNVSKETSSNVSGDSVFTCSKEDILFLTFPGTPTSKFNISKK